MKYFSQKCAVKICDLSVLNILKILYGNEVLSEIWIMPAFQKCLELELMSSINILFFEDI